jgi:RHS repeat-associated protein
VVKADASTLTFARDGSKNVRAEVSASGTVTAAFRYRAYGQTAQGTIPSPSYLGLASQLIDPSGLYYMRARWYDAVTGRFMTRDALVADAMRPETLNAFGYAYASPLRWSDPSGNCPMCWGAVFGFVGYAAITQLTGAKWDWTQAGIATATGAATGGVSAVMGMAGFTGAALVAMRVSGGAAVAGVGQIASTDAKLLGGQLLTQSEISNLPASMLLGGGAQMVPIKDPDLTGRARGFLAGIGLGGLNAVVGEVLKELITPFFNDGSSGISQ